MKNKFALLSICLFRMGLTYGQSFEGEIIYANSFKSKMTTLSDGQLAVIIGTKQEYFIKGGKYKSILNGQSLKMQLYDCATNRIYSSIAKSDTLYWFDASANTDSVITYEIRKGVEEILGKRCNAIIMKTRTGTTTIYYAAQYKVQSGLYASHHYNNWAFYCRKAGALPLKIIIETSKFRMESLAVKIKPARLDGDCFAIDKGTPTKKSL